MALFPKHDGRRQTPWGSMTTCDGDPIWYANITPDIDDLSVIEDAKTIVDACYPQQKSTFFTIVLAANILPVTNRIGTDIFRPKNMVRCF
jgi:hypothetical protein